MFATLLAARLCASLAVAQGMDFGQDQPVKAAPAQPVEPQQSPPSRPPPPPGATSDTSPGLQVEGVRKARFNDIERGFSLRIPVGMLSFLTPVKNESTTGQKNFGPGMLMGMELAYDIVPIFDIGGFFYFNESPGVASGDRRDLTTLLGGLVAHLSFFHTQRWYLGVKAGAGYGMLDDGVEKRQLGIGAIGALTVEYYTRLRHVSLGLDIGTVIWTQPVAVALTVLPAIRWTY